MKTFTSKSQKIGEIGEDIAIRYLEKQGNNLVERNYTRKCGEIDIIVRKGKVLKFVEVKTVSCENISTINIDEIEIRPEENVHEAKKHRIGKTIEVYCLEKAIKDTDVWHIDLVLVYLDMTSKQAKVRLLENIIL